MAKQQKNVNPFEVRERRYVCELYADNRQHMQSLARIKRLPDFKENFVGIWHIQYDEKGNEIINETGKKHCHIIFDFEHARRWSAMCKKCGLVDPAGMPLTRFLSPVGYYREFHTFENGLVYLTHTNAPSKEQYPVSALWGSARLVDLATRLTVQYQAKKITQAESLQAIRKWITSHYGERISPTAFIDWITRTPYCRCASNPWVSRMIEAHNLAVSNNYSEYQMEQYAQGIDALNKILEERGFVSIE